MTTVLDFRAGAHLSEGRRIGHGDAGGRIRPGRQGKSFSGSLGSASRSPAGMRSLQEVTRLLATVRRPVTRRDVWPDRFRAISALCVDFGRASGVLLASHKWPFCRAEEPTRVPFDWWSGSWRIRGAQP